MVDFYIDVADKETVSVTTYPNEAQYSAKAPFDKYIIVSQISLGIDSNFSSNGKVQIFIGDRPITSNNSADKEIGLITNLTLDFREQDFVFVEPQQTIDVYERVTSGSGDIQIAVTGTLVTREEFELLRKKYLGVN